MSKTKKKSGTTPPVKKNYPKWFYLIALVIPFILIILIEAGLRIFNYGQSYNIFGSVYPAYPNMLFLNPATAKKYFVNLQNPPTAIPDGFSSSKSSNTFRVFVLGESSAAGWPYIPNASFPRHIKRKLELLYPGNRIEVINLGMSAICTYTLRDYAEALTEQSPDLVLIYTGHNEYYGALGVASTQSVAGFSFLNRLYLDLIGFRSIQLLRNSISWIMGAVSARDIAGSPSQNETLMSRMVGENLVPYNSSLYKAGIEQFESNMREIIELLKERNIPVVLSTLTSNLRGIKPFESFNDAGLPGADKIYEEAARQLSAGDTASAKKSYLYARDLDALRFRAPSEFNNIIKKLASEYQVPYADIENVFNQNSPYGITGNNLMVDHLHPDLRGYRLIADEFFRIMQENSFLPVAKKLSLTDDQINNYLSSEFPFTKLDSAIADLRIKILTGGYPFKPKGEKNLLVSEFRPSDVTDSLAMMVVDRVLSLEEAHAKAAERFWEKSDYASAAKEIGVLIGERPFNHSNYEQLITMLIDQGQFDLALPYLRKYEKVNSGAFTNKWIGGIYLNKGDHVTALPYLQKSYSYKADDPQLLYNLSGAYYLNKRPKEAYEAIRQCLAINPQNEAAQALYSQLRPRTVD